jgi:hypothetical protein
MIPFHSMPGYPLLSAKIPGSAAECVREAEIHRRNGDSATAAAILEQALEHTCRATDVLPAWICGRLAAAYRTLKRYDDEVRLLERYQDTQLAEDARGRLVGRLSKARALAHRHRQRDTGALMTLRELRKRSITRRDEQKARKATASRGVVTEDLADD